MDGQNGNCPVGATNTSYKVCSSRRRKWAAEIILIADKTITGLSWQGNKYPTHSLSICIRRYQIGMLTPIEKPHKSFTKLLKRVQKGRVSKWLPVTCHSTCIVWTALPPYKRDYFKLPALFDLPWPFMAEAASKRYRELKSSIASSLSLSFALNLFFFSQALPLSILFREMLKQKLGSSVQMTGQ